MVRFTDVDPERIAAIVARIKDNEGPPPGVESTGMKLIYDESGSTAVFVGFFDSEEKMRKSAEVLEQMDPSETPGTRASVDMGEVKVEADA
ncbi:MAG: hypothetical protein M3N56_07615 [Actinomycetota bacterium]|nr:hypothetical protein [Actinomycetota bacterium]